MTFQIAIIFLLVNSIHFSMKPHEILEDLGLWIERHVPEKLLAPVYGCNVCMTPWYGSALYWLLPWQHSLTWWPVIVISAMGLNVCLNKLAPKK